jgi:cytochrome c-type biogenesis protein CcmH
MARFLPVINLFLVFTLAVTAIMSMAAPVHAEEPLSAEGREIARMLLCPVCENLSVLDSPSPLAQQMRGIIHEKLAAGESREQVLDYFVDRYGEGVLVEPPKRGFTLFVWLGPLIIAIGGAAVVTVTLRRWLMRRSEAAGDEEEDYEGDAGDLLEAELRRLT